MTKSKISSSHAKYSLNNKGVFSIENYNQSKLFSNFFPGIAGLWGIPMWVFYVNRGQCVTSFGIEAKSKSIMEFQPANKAYRLTSLQGFRTFIKVTKGKNVTYWEPFQSCLLGTSFKKKVKMSMTAHDLSLEEINEDLGLAITVNYFTLAEEAYAGLIRRVTIKNLKKTACRIEVVDGLPVIIPYGLTDELNKNISRTIEAWVKVRAVEEKTPYYQLNVEVSDEPKVKHIEEGNFYFSFNPQTKELLDPIVEAEQIFGSKSDFTYPENFADKKFAISAKQQTSNRSPSAMCHQNISLAAGKSAQIVSVIGYADTEDQLRTIVDQVTAAGFIEKKAKRNKEIIDEIRNFALTTSSSNQFNLYSEHTFLDNILRGGLPISVKTSDGYVGFNVYSRKHGDLERDYNYFTVSPTFYSQGNGNYRDVNQNRRNDVWFNQNIKEDHLVGFLNLSQADGYNPLVVTGTSFLMQDVKQLEIILNRCVESKDHALLKDYFKKSFQPGEMIKFVTRKGVKLKCDIKDFTGQILERCSKQEQANHGEGFWSDHWTYNLDLVESYFAMYPENLKDTLLNKKVFEFYLNSHFVLPRDQRYILTDRGVRQYESVAKGAEVSGNRLRGKNGEGAVYSTHLSAKLLCLIANKVASLDPSGVGVEMEADKPNWCDSLNGLPGLLGSSISETLEVKRFSAFLLESYQKLNLKDDQKIAVFEELTTFISGLTDILSTQKDAHAYWVKSNDIKELYRQKVRRGITGVEKALTVGELKNFLNLVIEKTNKALKGAKNDKGFLATYFYHDVTQHQVLDKAHNEQVPFVRPLAFKKHTLPLFLEGYVHALKAKTSTQEAREYYHQVRQSNLFDKKIKMYKICESLAGESEEIGRMRIFPAGWLENESVWLHMEYKFMLELIRQGLYEEFYDNFKHVLVAFHKPEKYGRSTLENSSFIVSSAHEDQSLHGRGFVARLSGSTAEFMHIWLLMNVGHQPFALDNKGDLILSLCPVLAGWLFTNSKTSAKFLDKDQKWQKIDLPKNSYAFNFLGSTLVVYHNPKRKDTFGPKKAAVKSIEITFPGREPVIVKSSTISGSFARDIREGKARRIDVYFQ